MQVLQIVATILLLASLATALPRKNPIIGSSGRTSLSRESPKRCFNFKSCFGGGNTQDDLDMPIEVAPSERVESRPIPRAPERQQSELSRVRKKKLEYPQRLGMRMLTANLEVFPLRLARGLTQAVVREEELEKSKQPGYPLTERLVLAITEAKQIVSALDEAGELAIRELQQFNPSRLEEIRYFEMITRRILASAFEAAKTSNPPQPHGYHKTFLKNAIAGAAGELERIHADPEITSRFHEQFLGRSLDMAKEAAAAAKEKAMETLQETRLGNPSSEMDLIIEAVLGARNEIEKQAKRACIEVSIEVHQTLEDTTLKRTLEKVAWEVFEQGVLGAMVALQEGGDKQEGIEAAIRSATRAANYYDYMSDESDSDDDSPDGPGIVGRAFRLVASSPLMSRIGSPLLSRIGSPSH